MNFYDKLESVYTKDVYNDHQNLACQVKINFQMKLSEINLWIQRFKKDEWHTSLIAEL